MSRSRAARARAPELPRTIRCALPIPHPRNTKASGQGGLSQNPRVKHLREKEKEVYQAILRALRGETTLSQRDIGRLAVQARQIGKTLAELAPAAERQGARYDFSTLSEADFGRLDRLNRKVRGQAHEPPAAELRVFFRSDERSHVTHPFPLTPQLIEGYRTLRTTGFAIVDDSGTRSVTLDELKEMAS